MAGEPETPNESDAKLWRLIEERSQAGADTAEIDQRIWDLFGEEWAIVFTDLVGFSRQVEEFGILHFLQVIHEQRKLLFPIIESHDGRLIKQDGDSLFLVFRQPERAVTCSLEMQRACATYNASRNPEDQIILCVGIGYGRVLRVGDADVWGKEVNSAAKLGEDRAKGHETLVTEAVRGAVAESLPDIRFEPAGTGFTPNDNVYRVTQG